MDGAALLGERAALAGLTCHGSRSCGGATRLLRAGDGWLALALARPDDVELVDVWLGDEMGVPVDVPVEDWGPIEAAIAQRTRADLVATATLLGLPCASLGEVSAASDVVRVAATAAGRDQLRGIDQLTVVDLSSLWAGPLCAQLLGQAGARVIKVESSTRPDGARFGPPEFFDLLHAGHLSVALDFTGDEGRRWLRRLIASADIVIEASRPRALAGLGAVVRCDPRRRMAWRLAVDHRLRANRRGQWSRGLRRRRRSWWRVGRRGRRRADLLCRRCRRPIVRAGGRRLGVRMPESWRGRPDRGVDGSHRCTCGSGGTPHAPFLGDGRCRGGTTARRSAVERAASLGAHTDTVLSAL